MCVYTAFTRWRPNEMSDIWTAYCKIITRLLQQAWCIHRHLAIFYCLIDEPGGLRLVYNNKKEHEKFFSKLYFNATSFSSYMCASSDTGDISGFASRTVRQSSWRLNAIHYHRGNTLLIYGHQFRDIVLSRWQHDKSAWCVAAANRWLH